MVLRFGMYQHNNIFTIYYDEFVNSILALVMSVFSTPPPNLSIEEAEDMIFDLYGLKTYATSLDSERDQNFLCTTPQNKQMVLKISNPAEDLSLIHI